MPADREHGLTREEARSLLRAHGITERVRFVQAAAAIEVKSEVADHGDGIYAVSGIRGHKAIVQITVSGVSCSCTAWHKTQSRNCDHITAVLAHQADSIGWTTRRPPTYWIYEDGALAESTRIQHAAIVRDARLDQLIGELCTYHIVDLHGRRAGRIGIPRRLAAVAMLLKVANDLTWSELSAFLADRSPILEQYGWRSHSAPNPLSLLRAYARFGNTPKGYPRRSIADELRSLFEVTARVAGKLDTMLALRDLEWVKQHSLRPLAYVFRPCETVNFKRRSLASNDPGSLTTSSSLWIQRA